MHWESYEQAMRLRECGKAEEALSELNKALDAATTPDDMAVVRMGIAHCWRYLGHPENARASLREALAVLDSQSDIFPRVMYVEALVEEDKGDWQAELEKLDEIVDKYKTLLRRPDCQDLNAEVFRHRGIALLGLGRYAEAKPLLEAALSEEYDRDLALNFLGQCCFAMGELKQAKEHFREALKLGLPPANELDVRYRLGVIHHRLGELAWALQEFEWCYEHRRQGPLSEQLILNALKLTLDALGKHNEAQRLG